MAQPDKPKGGGGFPMKKIATLTMAAFMFAALSCGGGDSGAAPTPKTKEYPEWVMKGSGAFGGEAKVFYGVGTAGGVKNVALARTTADNRARGEIGKIFNVYVASLMKDYMASTTAGDMSASSEEQHIETAQKTFSAATLVGVEIVNHWVDPDDGTWYALARLDLATFQDSINKVKELDDKTKNYVRENAAKSFDALEKEEGKHETK
jgi:hypothetical protein